MHVYAWTRKAEAFNVDGFLYFSSTTTYLMYYTLCHTLLLYTFVPSSQIHMRIIMKAKNTALDFNIK